MRLAAAAGCKQRRCNMAALRCSIGTDGAFDGVAMSESLQEFRVAVLATDDVQFAFQIFRVSGEPRTLQRDSPRYTTPADAAEAGYEAIASMRP
jgi:hypothetical protein